MMEQKKKNDAVIKAVGIAGLLLLLAVFYFSNTGKNLPTEQRHDHSAPTPHGKSIRTEEVGTGHERLQPSGTLEDGKRKLAYEAFQYGFSPDPLVVLAGENVELSLKSRDLTHGMMIPDIDFNAEILPDKTTTATFKAPAKPGKYQIFCTVFCGSGHGDMSGTLLVLPATVKPGDAGK